MGSKPKGSRLAPHHAAFVAAHLDPFSQDGDGAKQPSQFPLATNPYKVLATAECTSSSTGTFGAILTPNPFYTVTQIANANDGSVSGLPAGLNVANGATNALVYAASNDLPNKAEKWRSVSIAFNIKPVTNFTSTAGYLYAAFVPSGEYYPFKMGNGANAASLGEFLGVPLTSTGVSNAITNLPHVRQYSIAELLSTGGAEFVVPISSPRHEDWLDVASYADYPGLAFTSTGAGTFAGVVTPSYSQTAGWGTLVLYATGLPASTKVFTVQALFRCEVTPIVAGTTANAFIPSGIKAAPATDPSMKHRLLSAIASSPSIRTREEALKMKGIAAFKKALGPAEKALGLGTMLL